MRLIKNRILKAILCLFICFICENICAQINISEKNKSIREIIYTIEKVSDYNFFFNNAIPGLDKKTSIHLSGSSIEEVLNILLKDTDITYTVKEDNQVVLTNLNILESKDTKASQQTPVRPIKGTVIDVQGEPVIGANVIEKGTTNGVITDVDGHFSVQVTENAVLQISYIGYNQQEIPVRNQNYITITLLEDLQALDEVVVVGYGTQKKVNLTGAVSSINNKALTVAPVANTTNALAGRLPGLTVIQNSGQPGSDEASLNIRGFNNLQTKRNGQSYNDGPLIIVDGIEAPFRTIDPNMIESVTILKDGSASIYGSRAGNGVILVTTKRGIQQKPTFTFNSNLTLQGVTSMPRPTNAGQYAELEREKWIQSGRPVEQAPFTEEQVQKYYDGTDPQYPNTDWYDELVRDWAPQQQYNLSVRGGSEAVKYYGFIGYMNQQSMWKKNGGNYNQYNLQSNIDATISKNLSFQLDLAAIINDRKFPARGQGAGGDNVWQDFWNTLPIYPATLPDPTKISYADGGGTGGAHVTSNYNLMGYNK